MKKLSLILIAGLLIRLFGFGSDTVFSAEFGHNLLAVKNSVFAGQIPLVGPPTSHPWLSFGPFYYWMISPILFLSNFNPLGPKLYGIVFGVLMIGLNYVAISRIFSKNLALLTSFFMAFSPMWVEFSQSARFYFFATTLVYLFIWTLHDFRRNPPCHMFLLGLIFGTFISFHYSLIIYAPVALIFLLITNRSKISTLKYGFLGATISISPILISDSLNNFKMFKNFGLWVPYRIAGFMGLYPKNNISQSTTQNTLEITYKFLGKSFTENQDLWSYIIILFGISILLLLKNIKTNKGILISLLSLFFGLVAVVVHGDAPIHYFLPIFPLPFIVVGSALLSIKNSRLRNLALIGIVLMVFLNIKYIFKPEVGNQFINLTNVSSVSRSIVADANGRKFNLKRTGEGDGFEGNFAQNYQYLMWLYGNEPIENAKLEYTIIEKDNNEIQIIKKL